tara:strand:- start:185 stop:601 length:417 start_codon:yes stop_codon:yes gene_type:complete
MSIEEKIQYYKESLDIFEDTMDKYKFLLEQGKNSKKFPEEFRQDNFKVKGCQSQVWVVPYIENDLLCFHTDSDAFLTKGMITILADIYGENLPTEILSSDFDLIKQFNLNIILTPGRTNGVYSMLNQIKNYAETFSKK